MALVFRFLQKPRSVFWILLLFLVLISPVFYSPYSTDDFFQILILSGSDFIHVPKDSSLFGLFSFIEPPPADRSALMQYSMLPWWTSSGFYFRFWRPLTEASHWLDYQLFGASPFPAHVHNVLWFIALAFAAWSVYKKTLFPVDTATVAANVSERNESKYLLAALAFMAFVFDNSHAPMISWISNRNAIMAAVFGLLCLSQHIAWRDSDKFAHFGLAMLALVLSLLSAEASLAIGGYLFAYAVCLDRRGPLKGFIALLPYLVLVAVYLVYYKSAGFGSAGSSIHYVDPISNPVAFSHVLVQRLPVLLYACFGILPAELYSIVDFLNTQWGQWYWWMVVASLLLLFAVLWPLIKRNASLRFCLLGAVVAGVPICALFPQDRLTLFITIGANGAIAIVLFTVYRQWQEIWSRPVTRFLGRTTGVLFLVFHIILAPPLLWAFAEAGRREAVNLNKDATELPLPDKEIAGSYLVMVEAPLMTTLMSTPLRLLRHRTLPDKVFLVSTDVGNSVLTTIDDHTIEVFRKQGFVYKTEAGYRDPFRNPIPKGFQVDLHGIRLTVVGLEKDGRPNRVRIEFDRPVIGDGVKFLTGEGGGLKSFVVPPIGQSIDL